LRVARLFVLDAMGLAYRAYYAFISRPLTNARGENISAIFGLANTVLKTRREQKPDYWALAWDGPGPTFRHERFPDYKATRKPMPKDLVTQIEPSRCWRRRLGCRSSSSRAPRPTTSWPRSPTGPRALGSRWCW